MKLIPLITLLLLLVSCSNDAYDTGDGSLSFMRADFVEAVTDASSAVTSIATDDGETLNVSPSYTPQWTAKADTIYRALAYYNKVEAKQGGYKAEMIALSQVLVPTVQSLSALKDGLKTDPVTLESAWMSRNRKYLNLDINVKTGTTDGETAAQTIGVICTEVTQHADGTHTVALTLYHDQNGVPEYYSAECYISVPLSVLPVTLSEGDKVQVSVNSYSGEVTKVIDF